MNKGFASKTGSAALALSLLYGQAWAVDCAQPWELTALQTAAVQQQLMVAAFTCNDIAAYNDFVTAFQGELQLSDRALLSFFLQRNTQTGDGDYDSYKTGLANASALRSVHDPRFCSDADITFRMALDHAGQLAELVSERPSPIQTGYRMCVPSRLEAIVVATAIVGLPARHAALADTLPSAAIVAPDSDPGPDGHSDRAGDDFGDRGGQ